MTNRLDIVNPTAIVGLKEQILINKLATLLRGCGIGDTIVSSRGVLCLTTQVLSALTRAFTHLPSGVYTSGSASGARGKASQDFGLSVAFLWEIFKKTSSLKIIHNSVTIVGVLSLDAFSSLTVLEIKKLPIHLVTGLNECRSRLKVITCSRCLNNMQELFESCGADMSVAMSWTRLRHAQLSHNSITHLDSSLRLVPMLESIDLSHNEIAATERNLEYLTDIEKVNLGFNQLSVVPKFSFTAHSRLKHLVLRNNLLENINGVEHLVNLRLLDVSCNGLSEHACLAVLNNLEKLHTLWTTENPLTYHKHHRRLTIHQLPSACMYHTFLLDGKALTAQEHQFVVKSRVSISRRPSLQADRAITAHGHQRAADDTYSHVALPAVIAPFYDEVSRSLPATTSRRSKRSKQRRGKVKTRHAIIAEMDSSDWTETSSRDSSPASSPTRCNLQKDYQIMRDHYGPNWLSKFNQSTHTRKNSDEVIAVTTDRVDVVATEDDLYMNESMEIVRSITDVVDSPAEVVEGRQTTPDVSPVATKDHTESVRRDGAPRVKFDDVPQVKVDGVPQVKVDGVPQVKVDGVPQFEVDGVSESSLDNVASRTSVRGIEWCLDETESAELYGPECEPLVVTRVHGGRDDSHALFVSLNSRYLIERSVDATVHDMLDLCLLASLAARGREVRLKFDYMRKDRRKRCYVMETDDDLQTLTGLLKPFIEAYNERIRAETERTYECLKCSTRFTRSAAPQDDASEEKCPKCSSELVIEVSDQGSSTTTPVGSYSSASEVKPMTSTPIPSTGDSDRDNDDLKRSKTAMIKSLFPFSSRKAPDPAKTLNKVSSMPCMEHLIQESTPILEFTRSFNLDSITKRDEFIIGDRAFGKQDEDADRGSKAVKREIKERLEGSSDEGRGVYAAKNVVGSQGGSSSVKTDNVDKTGSDITILSNPSKSSIAVISDPNLPKSDRAKFSLDLKVSRIEETTSAKGSNFDHDRAIHSLKRLAGAPNSKSDHSPVDPFREFSIFPDGIDAKTVADDVNNDLEASIRKLSGSPLSSTVCKSMVKSVYVNSIPTQECEAGDKPQDESSPYHLSSRGSLTVLDSVPAIGIYDSSDSGAFESSVAPPIAAEAEATSSYVTDGMRSRSGAFSGTLSNKTRVQDGDPYRRATMDSLLPSNSQHGSSSIHTSFDSYFNRNASPQTDVSSTSRYSHKKSSNTIPRVFADSEQRVPEQAIVSGYATDGMRNRSGAFSGTLYKNGTQKDVFQRRATPDGSVADSTHSLPSNSRRGCDNDDANNRNTSDDCLPSLNTSENFTNEIYLDRIAQKQTRSSGELSNKRDQQHPDKKIVHVSTSCSGSSTDSVSTTGWRMGSCHTLSPTDLMLSEGDRFYGSFRDLNKIDHRLKLYFEMELFQEPREELQGLLRCGCVQYMGTGEWEAMLLVSSVSIYILKILDIPDCDVPEKQLKCVEKQPLAEIRYLDIGLGSQSFRLEFGHVTGSYSFVVIDNGLCLHFISVLTGIIQNPSLTPRSQLQGITKYQEETMRNLETQVLHHGRHDNETPNDSDAGSRLVLYVKVFLAKDGPNLTKDNRSLVSLAVTKRDLFVVDENHQWPLPRLQAPPTDAVKGSQFTLREQQGINNILHMAVSEDRQLLQVDFLGDDNTERTWYVASTTSQTTGAIISAIRGPWEEQFGIALDVGVLELQ